MTMAELRKLLLIVAVALAAITAVSFLGEQWWMFDLAAHFRPHLAVAALGAAVVAAAVRARLAALALALVLLGNAAPLGLRFASAGATECGAPGDLRFLALNLHGLSTSPAAFRRLIEAERPDVVLLTELPRDLAPLIDDLAELPPHSVLDRRGSSFDVALFSRWPIAAWRMDRSVHSYLPVLTADICAIESDGGAPACLRVVGLHAARPFEEKSVPQNAQLRLAAELAKAAPAGRAVLLGDLNLTPWSPRFGRLLAAGGLRDVSTRRPFAATWHSPLPFMGLTLDHVLTGAGLTVTCRRAGSDVGSDHLPVIADVAIDAATGGDVIAPAP